MLEIKTKIKARRGAYKVQTKGTLRLPFDQRRCRGCARRSFRARRSRWRCRAARSCAAAISSSPPTAASSRSRPKRARVNVECDSPAALARCAYELGSRHVAVEVGDGCLRVAADPELEDMLRASAQLTPMDAPFEPDAGAVAAGHSAGETRLAEPRTIGHDTGTPTTTGTIITVIPTITITTTTRTVTTMPDHDHAHCDHPHHHPHNDASRLTPPAIRRGGTTISRACAPPIARSRASSPPRCCSPAVPRLRHSTGRRARSG